VAPGDTIQGVAIRHDTTVQRLRKLNSLPGARSIHDRDELVVPLGPSMYSTPTVEMPNLAEFRQLARFAIVKEFMRQTGCGVEDATIYLDLLDWNVVAALREYAADAQSAPNAKDSAGAQKSIGVPSTPAPSLLDLGRDEEDVPNVGAVGWVKEVDVCDAAAFRRHEAQRLLEELRAAGEAAAVPSHILDHRETDHGRESHVRWAECGRASATATPASASRPKFCSTCGIQVEAAWTFCKSCGMRIKIAALEPIYVPF